MHTDVTGSAVLSLVEDACEGVTPNRFSLSRSRHGIAYCDTERDRSITGVATFAGAMAALQGDPAICAVCGPDNAHRPAIQFVYNTCGLLESGVDIPKAFEATEQR